MAIEGKFSDSGLQSMDDGSDVLTTLARELVMHQGVGQSADEVWKALQAQAIGERPSVEAPQPEIAPEAPLVATPRSALRCCSGRTCRSFRRGGGRPPNPPLSNFLSSSPAAGLPAVSGTNTRNKGDRPWQLKHHCHCHRHLLRT